MDISCVMNRRSVREYTTEPIKDTTLRTLLKAGMYAPSARNSQPWEFVVVQERSMLNKLSEGAPYWKMLQHAPLAIVVVANLAGYQASTKEFFIQDCAASTMNILNASTGSGLGAVWLGVYGVQERMAYVADTLGIPGNIHPFCIISLGYPAKQPQPHDFFHEDKVHYNTY